MITATNFSKRALCSALLTLFTFACTSFAQQNPPDNQSEEVLRINTELVQTGVTVFDKQGRFVEGLKPEQFEIKVDGKPVKVSFFDRVTAGTASEEKQVAGALGSNAAKTAIPAGASFRGRTIIFFVDDLHLSLSSLGRARSALAYFIEKQMMPTDQVAFVSASGQIGFLQQFTDNKAVLRSALARLKPLPDTVRDTDQPPMPEFIALKIVNGDRNAADYYIDKIIEGFFNSKAPNRAVNRNAVYEMVKTRANHIAIGLESVAGQSLTSLENLLRNNGQILGRKLVFFISDGFYINAKGGSAAANTPLQRVTDTATRTGSVIYTIDARGLFAPIADATGDRPFDPKGRLDTSMAGEGILSQDGLNALAGDTGGRFLKNQNYFDSWVARMLDETSNYYLLAWRPEADNQKNGNFKRIEVSVTGRPDLTIRLPRGFLSGGEAKSETKKPETKPATTESGNALASTAAKGTDAALITALGAPSARKGLPTQLSASFVDVPGSGTVLTASMQMATDVLNYGADGKQPAAVDLAGVILNDQGKPAGSFKNRLNVNPLPSSGAKVENPGVIYNHRIPLKPGIYQIRVAARDDKSGRVGSAAQWIEIPDLSTKHLTLSSLLVGGQFVGSGQKQTMNSGTGEQVQFSVDRRFARGSHMSFLTIIYNAAGSNGSSAPNLEAQIEITRDGQPIINSPGHKVTVEANADVTRIPYGADLGLKTLPAGRYLLKVTITDHNTNASASQQVAFDID
jgi:VWFA-related protein